MESYHERPYLIVSIENGLVFLLVVRCLKNTGNDSVLHRSLCLPYNTWEVTGAWEIVVPQRVSVPYSSRQPAPELLAGVS